MKISLVFFIHGGFENGTTQNRYIYIYIGLSPLPVIVEMKVYRDSLLKM